MTVYPSGTINPTSIVSGQSIKVFNSSYAVGETLIRTQAYVNQQLSFTANGTAILTYTWAAGQCFYVGDTVLISPLLAPLVAGKTYWVVAATATTFRLSETKGGSQINVTAGTGGAYVGADSVDARTGQFPELRPYPVTTAVTRQMMIYAEGSGGGSAPHTGYISPAVTFYTLPNNSYLAKPAKTSNFALASIFIYSPHPYIYGGTATIVNRRWTPNQGFIYSNLKFTGSINKAGTASFVITGRGGQTTDEENLLLSDNWVVIIVGDHVAWSGKILRSAQSKMTLFNSSSNVKQWEIECESDISKMRQQNIKPANKGSVTGKIGYVVSKLVEASVDKVYNLPGDINWNGDDWNLPGYPTGYFVPALRSNEGPSITYNITDADMFTQLTALRNVIDFDVRTRLINYKYHYIQKGSNWLGVGAFSPYSIRMFVGMWCIITGQSNLGVVSYGRCGSNSPTNVVLSPAVNWDLVASTGTMIIIGDPILDMVSDLSQPSVQANFIGNSPKSTTLSNGYEFDDKTDRKVLATKVIAKGKASNGTSITCAMAAVTPWNSSLGAFEGTTIITSRTEGVVIGTYIVTSGVDAGVYVTLEGWGYPGGGYFAVRTASGVWKAPSSHTLIMTATETYSGTQRVTLFKLLYVPATGYYTAVIGDLLMITTATYPPTAPFYGYFYIESPTNLGYAAGANIYIGGETIQTTNIGLHPIKGYAVGYLCDGTALHREAASPLTNPHSTGAPVYLSTGYSETAPVAGSPVNYHGLILQTYTVDQNISPQTLELYASLCLIAYSYYYRKANFWCTIYDFYKQDTRGPNDLTTNAFLEPGDRIGFLPKSSDNYTQTLYGQYKNIWQIVSFTVDTDTFQVTVDLGDFERNVFTLLADKTSAINQTIT